MYMYVWHRSMAAWSMAVVLWQPLEYLIGVITNRLYTTWRCLTGLYLNWGRGQLSSTPGPVAGTPAWPCQA